MYLLVADKNNIVKIKREITTLAGVPINDLIQKRPKILMTKIHALYDMLALFSKYGIPESSVARYPELFTLSVETVRRRIEELNKDPVLSTMTSHPQVGRIIYYQKKILDRIKYFNSLNTETPTLHVLSADTKRFKQIVAAGDLKNKGTDVVHILSQHFGKTCEELRQSITRHPHWLTISMQKIQESLKYLEGRGDISKEQIFHALPIVLYPRLKIEKELEYVLANNEASVKDMHLLHLVLYYLEKPVHFTGDGLWPSEHSGVDEDDPEPEEFINLNSQSYEKDKSLYRHQHLSSFTSTTLG